MSRLTAITLLGLASTAPSGVESFSSLASTSKNTCPAFRTTPLGMMNGERISINPRGEGDNNPRYSFKSNSRSRLQMGSDFSSHPYSHYYGTSGSTAKQNFEQNDQINDIYGYGSGAGPRDQDRLADIDYDIYSDYYDGGGGRDRRMMRDRGSRRLDDLREGPRGGPRRRGAPNFSKRFVEEERMMEEDRRMRDLEFRRRNTDLAGRVEERHVLDRMDELIMEHDRLARRLDDMEAKSEELSRQANERTDEMLRAVHEEQQEATKLMMQSVLAELQVVQRTLLAVQNEQRRTGYGSDVGSRAPEGPDRGPPPPPRGPMGGPMDGSGGGGGRESPPPETSNPTGGAAASPPKMETPPPPQSQSQPPPPPQSQRQCPPPPPPQSQHRTENGMGYGSETNPRNGPISPPPPTSQSSVGSRPPSGASYGNPGVAPQGQSPPPGYSQQPPPPPQYQQPPPSGYQQPPPPPPPSYDYGDDDDLRGRPAKAIINGGVNGNAGSTFKTGPPKMVDPDAYGNARGTDEPTNSFQQRKMGLREKPQPPERSTAPRKQTLRDRVFQQKGRDENQVHYGAQPTEQQPPQQQQQQQQQRGGIPPQQQGGYGGPPPPQGGYGGPPPPHQGAVSQQPPPPQQPQQQGQTPFPQAMQTPQAQQAPPPPPPPQQQAPPPPPPPPSSYDQGRGSGYPQGGVNTFEPGGQQANNRRPPPSRSNSFGNFGGQGSGGRPRGRASGFGGVGGGRGGSGSGSGRNFGEETGTLTFQDSPDGGRCFLT